MKRDIGNPKLDLPRAASLSASPGQAAARGASWGRVDALLATGRSVAITAVSGHGPAGAGINALAWRADDAREGITGGRREKQRALVFSAFDRDTGTAATRS